MSQDSTARTTDDQLAHLKQIGELITVPIEPAYSGNTREPDSAPSFRFVDPEAGLRPTRLDEIIGQDDIKRTLRIYLRAAKGRNEALDHVLITGPAGLGKTTFASVIATEMGWTLKTLAGSQVTTQTILNLVAEMISNPEKKWVVFIDEIHGIHKDAMTLLLPLLEDFRLEDIELRPFTLVGATTDPAKMISPLRERFGITYHLDYYPDSDIETILRRSLGVLLSYTPEDVTELTTGDLAPAQDPKYAGHTFRYPVFNGKPATPKPGKLAIESLAKRSRGVPRTANRLLKRTLDFMFDGDAPIEYYSPTGHRMQIVDSLEATKYKPLTPEIVTEAMSAMGIDARGLTKLDRAILVAMLTRFNNRPVGVRAIASALGNDFTTIETVNEPMLVRQGYINRELRGRHLTTLGMVTAAEEMDGRTAY